MLRLRRRPIPVAALDLHLAPHHPRAHRFGKANGFIGALVIDQEHLIGPLDAGHAVANPRGLVLR